MNILIIYLSLITKIARKSFIV